MSRPSRTETKVTRAGIASDRAHGAVVPPLHLSTNFTFDGLGGKRRYDYTRSGNPTRDELSAALAELEGGVGAVVTSSGMSAVALVTQLLLPGDLLVAPHDCYGGTHRLFSALRARGIRVEFVDQSDERALDAVCAESPAMIWIETPSNPLLRIVDVRQLVRRARAISALTVVDNTFLSPVFQRPIELGADLVVHSTTKYLNGHSDVVGGCVVAADPGVLERCEWWGNCLGSTGAPFDSYLALRGLRTLHVRMAAHERNAAAVVEMLVRHRAVSRVHHPSLVFHPGHEVAVRQQSGFGAMVSFELHGGLESARRVCESLEHFTLAESLGGVESLIAHPATMTHAAMDAADQARAGITAGLLRLSVGIEHPDDLCGDLVRALDTIPELSTR